MNATGRIFEVTNASRFIATYLVNPENPDQTTFRPISSARIHIGSVLPGPLFSFFPSFNVNTNSDSRGIFTIDCSKLPSTYPVYLVAYRQLQVLNVFGMSVPIYGPIYRSRSFQLSSIDNKPRTFYVIQKELPNDQGISQGQINESTNQAKNSLPNLDSISVFITDNAINVVGKGKGATVSFRITLSPSTSPDLDVFIKHKIEDFDCDLPGWDFITRLCVSEDNIEKEVRDGVSNVVKAFNQQIKQAIINEIANEAGVDVALVTSMFNSSLSLTFNKINYPVVETKKIGPVTIKFRAVVPDPCLGVPRTLYA